MSFIGVAQWRGKTSVRSVFPSARRSKDQLNLGTLVEESEIDMSPSHVTPTFSHDEMSMVTFPGGRRKKFPLGTSLQVVAEDPLCALEEYDAVALRVNGVLESLAGQLTSVQCNVQAVGPTSLEGHAVMTRSLVFLLGMASQQVFPNRRLLVQHRLGNSYHCNYDGEEGPLSEADLLQLEGAMRSIIKSDMPIGTATMSSRDAVVYFKKRNRPSIVWMLEGINEPVVALAVCAGHMDLTVGPLAAWTSVLGRFALQHNHVRGFLFRLPTQAEPMQVGPPPVVIPLLAQLYTQYSQWGRVLDCECVGKVNKFVHDGKVKDFIMLAEALHDQKIVKIAEQIYNRRDKVRCILIAGPSSSGKTTFASKLVIQCKLLGLQCVSLSVDDYYGPRLECPRDDEGNYNFESLYALRLDLLNKNLNALFRGEEIESPLYDFVSGTPSDQRGDPGVKVKLPKNGILLMEGIHCLNDEMTRDIPLDAKFKVFLAPLSRIHLDEHNHISNATNRVLRRMVRDFKRRGYEALETMQRWPSVRRGENRNIFPFMKSADAIFNSNLDYEVGVLRVYVEPLLKSVGCNHPEYNMARGLLEYLSYFHPIPDKFIPPDSLLREFIGGSIFHDE